MKTLRSPLPISVPDKSYYSHYSVYSIPPSPHAISLLITIPVFKYVDRVVRNSSLFSIIFNTRIHDTKADPRLSVLQLTTSFIMVIRHCHPRSTDKANLAIQSTELLQPWVKHMRINLRRIIVHCILYYCMLYCI